MTTSVLVLVPQGLHSFDADRVRSLLDRPEFDVSLAEIDRRSGAATVMRRVIASLRHSNYDVVYLEGTGLRVGVPLLFTKFFVSRRIKYVVSSGDAVDRYVRNRYGYLPYVVARLYESLLYRHCAAFIGWTPYLVGRAIRMGAPMALTIEGQSPKRQPQLTDSEKLAIRKRLGAGDSDVLIGVSGSINWSGRQSYAYGLELVEAASRTREPRLRFVIIGGGTGRSILMERAAELGVEVEFVDRVPRDELLAMISALDVAVISQTPDELGMLRLTTKLPEYLSAGTPVILPAIPAAFDYFPAGPTSPIIVVPAKHPGSPQFWTALASTLDGLSRDDLQARRDEAKKSAVQFDSADAGLKLLALFDLLAEQDA